MKISSSFTQISNVVSLTCCWRSSAVWKAWLRLSPDVKTLGSSSLDLLLKLSESDEYWDWEETDWSLWSLYLYVDNCLKWFLIKQKPFNREYFLLLYRIQKLLLVLKSDLIWKFVKFDLLSRVLICNFERDPPAPAGWSRTQQTVSNLIMIKIMAVLLLVVEVGIILLSISLGPRLVSDRQIINISLLLMDGCYIQGRCSSNRFRW